ncbi:TPA: IS1-like element transposase [Klebsiella pneumoniae]
MAMSDIECRASAYILGIGLNTIFRHLNTQTQVSYPLDTAVQ